MILKITTIATFLAEVSRNGARPQWLFSCIVGAGVIGKGCGGRVPYYSRRTPASRTAMTGDGPHCA